MTLATGARRAALALGLAIAAPSCQTVPTATAAQEQEEAASASGMNAHALAQAACGGCHSVERNGLSPNPKAPEFPTIANRRGLTRASLTTWLRGAHNYPAEMDFYLEDDEVGKLVRYIMTLEDDNYEPPIQ